MIIWEAELGRLREGLESSFKCVKANYPILSPTINLEVELYSKAYFIKNR